MNRILLSVIAYALVCLNANAQQITVTQVTPNPVCQLSGIAIFFELSQSLPAGNYEIQLSGASGSSSYITLGSYIIQSGTSFALTVALPLVNTGNCYKIRVNRTTPPLITGTPSACIAVQNCGNTITTLAPVVTTDPDTVCAWSAIDIPFFSTGVYTLVNDYTAQLSDSLGEFIHYDTIIAGTDTTVVPRDVFEVLGMSENNNITYDPSTGSYPGSVPGVIPAVPEGCNYYIRVISNHPNAVGSIFGPFCIKHCDITTNNTIDISACIQETAGVDTTLSFDIHEWDNIAAYLPGNQFIVQVLDRMTLAIVNEGALGVKADTTSGTVTLSIPGRDSLAFLPGEFYMRIIANNSTHPWNSNGTLVRLTIGAPDDNSPIIVSDKEVYCNTEVGEFRIAPYNSNSDYYWYSAEFFGSSNAVLLEWHPVFFSFVGAQRLEYLFIVQEENYGCFGPASSIKMVNVVTLSDVYILGQDTVYIGDTLIFSTTHIDSAIYYWSISGSTIIKDDGDSIFLVFDSSGIFSIEVVMISDCGTAQDSKSVIVLPDTSISTGIASLDQNEIILYPNPVSDFLMISMPSQKYFNVIISDISGKKVFEQDSYLDEKINVSSLVPGIYFVKVDDNNGAFAYMKLVKAE